MMKREEILMLNLIEDSGNIKRLLRESLSYKDISELTSKLVKEDLLSYVDKKIVLTTKGKKTLDDGLYLIKETNKDLWIKPENKSRVKKIERNFIYLPNQTELDF